MQLRYELIYLLVYRIEIFVPPLLVLLSQRGVVSLEERQFERFCLPRVRDLNWTVAVGKYAGPSQNTSWLGIFYTYAHGKVPLQFILLLQVYLLLVTQTSYLNALKILLEETHD